MVAVVPSLLTRYSLHASVNQLNEVKPREPQTRGKKSKGGRASSRLGGKEKEMSCVKGQCVVFGVITGCCCCSKERRADQKCSRLKTKACLDYILQSPTPTHTQSRDPPSPAATNFKHTTMCCWSCLLSSESRAAADC